MKNLVKIIAIAFIPVLLGSCKRDHVCTCTYTTAAGSATEKHVLENQTKPDAVENCENFERNTGWLTANCNL